MDCNIRYNAKIFALIFESRALVEYAIPYYALYNIYNFPICFCSVMLQNFKMVTRLIKNESQFFCLPMDFFTNVLVVQIRMVYNLSIILCQLSELTLFSFVCVGEFKRELYSWAVLCV